MLGEGRDGSREGGKCRGEKSSGVNEGTENRHIQVVWEKEGHLK